MKVLQRHECRSCGATGLACFLEMPGYPFPDNHLRDLTTDREYLVDYRAYWCPSCKLVQTQHDIDWSEYYAGYEYTVSSSPLAREFMERLAANVCKRYDLKAGDTVIEVGSGDGYQLECFARHGLRVFGFEPSRTLAAQARARQVLTAETLFDESTVDRIPAEMRPVQAVISSYTLDHMPNPVAGLAAMREVLDPRRGIVVAEVHDLEKILERREACLFHHEHATYPSLVTLGRMMEKAGLTLIDADLVEERNRRGNSLLVAAAYADRGLPPASALLAPTPLLNRMGQVETYHQFARDVREAHARLAERVREGRRRGQSFAIYGAAGRAIGTLYLAGLTCRELEYACDMNPRLQGKYMPHSHVPVVAPEHAFQRPVDEIIVFSYGYMREIEQLLRPRFGGRLISVLDLLKESPSGEKGA